jgi:hypothetical protein
MELGIIGIIVAILAAVLLIKIIKFGIKVVLLTILAIILSVTIWICVAQPDMHDPFSVNTIEYLFKINKDGSMTTTKQVTQTVIKDKD